MWKEKAVTWDNVAIEYNSLTDNTNRSAKGLRLKYECVKRQTQNKYELFKTGGCTSRTNKFTDYKEKILNHILLTVEGLVSQNDCDADYLLEYAESEQKQHMAQNQSNTAENVIPLSNTSTGHICATMTTVDRPSDATVSVDIDLHILISKESNSSYNWEKWNAKQVKKPKHKALIAKQTPIKKDALNEKISAVTFSRRELVSLQMDNTKKEERQQKEHTEKLKLEHKIKNEQLKQQILELQLKNLLQSSD
ncbi:hypothetical protein FQA39_LY12617 [Lamprigera yunnana]|nr:hypothetical protein FQA39_LY12617 [Lamprigera yunnana]